MRKRTWSEGQLRSSVKRVKSIRGVLKLLYLKPSGGNYAQIYKYLKQYKIDYSHFTGKGWSKGLKGIGQPKQKLEQILINGSTFQSYKLKKGYF